MIPSKGEECLIPSKDGWVCNIAKGHLGNVHVAVGGGNRVLKVWEVPPPTTEKVLYYQP